MPSPSYELSAVHEEDGYRVTVVPKHGKTVTLYVVESPDTWWESIYSGGPVNAPRPGQSRYGRISGKYWYVKSGPEITEKNPGYIVRSKTMEAAAMAANRIARRYGRMCSRPLGRKS